MVHGSKVIGIAGTSILDIDKRLDRITAALINDTNLFNNIPHSYYLQSESLLHNLSSRESAWFFYLIRGKTAKQIANILNISPKTVESYISCIKMKWETPSKSALIEKAINNGFIHIIPNSLLAKQNQT